MSKFFKALEQAEQERALREHEPSRAAESAPVESAAPPAAVEAPAPQAPPLVAEPKAPARQAPPTAEPGPAARRGPGPVRTRTDGAPLRVEEHLVTLLTPNSYETEQYRALRHLLEQLHGAGKLTVVAVSSPAVADGKTTTAINLAGALAQGLGARVLLVDTDLRLPSVADALGLGQGLSPGLAEAILTPTLGLEHVVRECPEFNLSVLPAGHSPAARYEVLTAPRLGELLEQARRQYDYVVLDAPPLIPVPDCRVLTKWVDGFLVVVAAHRTPRKLLEEALNVMEPSKVIGLVFNGDDRPPWRYYGSYFASRQSDDGKNRGSSRSRSPR